MGFVAQKDFNNSGYIKIDTNVNVSEVHTVDSCITSNGSAINCSSQQLDNYPSIPDLHDFRFICEVVISLPVATLGIIGNVLAFIVLCNSKQKLSTTILLQALAIADTLVLTSSILLRSLRYVKWQAYDAEYYMIFLALYPCVYIFRLADTWLTVLLTIDRFIAVCYPLHAQRLCTRKRTCINIGVLSVLTFLFSMPRFFEFKYTWPNDFQSTDILFQTGYVIAYRIILFFLVMYLIPMIILLTLNTRLLCTLRSASRFRESTLREVSEGKHAVNHGNRTNRSITVIVITVVIVCVVCNLVAMVVHVIESIARTFYLMDIDITRRHLANISNILVTINSTINFVIYCLCSHNFRKDFVATLTCANNKKRRMHKGYLHRRSENDRSTFDSHSLSYNSNNFPLRVSIMKKGTLSLQSSNVSF